MNQNFGNQINKKGEFIAVAVRRKGNSLQLVSLPENKKYFVNESLLNRCGIILGDFCTFTLEKNDPINIRRATYSSDLRFTVNDDNASGANICGTLVNLNGAMFFRTKEFGNVAYLDVLGSSAPIGEEYPIIVRLLEEDEQVAAYSQYIWGAEIDRNPDKNSSKLPNFQNLKIVEDTESDDDDSSSEPHDDSARTVTGIVLEQVKGAENHFKVWTRESYSGNDGIIKNKGNAKIKPGDWVTLYFTKEQHELHFPMQKSNNSPPFETEKFRKMKPFHNTYFVANVLQITIRKFEFEKDHKQGDDLYDPIIGLISDEQKMAPNGSGNYDLTITLVRSFCKDTEEIARWKAVKAVKPEYNCHPSSSSQRNPVKMANNKQNKFKKEKVVASTVMKQQRKQDFKNAQKSPQKKVFNNGPIGFKADGFGESSQPKSAQPVVPNAPNANGPPVFSQYPVFGNPFMGPPMPPNGPQPIIQSLNGHLHMVYPLPNNFGPNLMNMPNQQFGKMPYQPPVPHPQHTYGNTKQGNPKQIVEKETDVVSGRGFEGGKEDFMRMKTTAVVMTVRHHAKDAVTYFLWLLEHHQPAAFNTITTGKGGHSLSVGHFFEGAFKRKTENDKWECVKYFKPAGKVMEGEKYGETVQMKVTIDKYYPVNRSQGQDYPRTWHKHFGYIVDNKHKLTKDCSGGVRIVTRMSKVDDVFVWVVIKNLDSPQTQLVRTFGEAWQNPAVREHVGRKEPMGYKKLKKHYSSTK